MSFFGPNPFGVHHRGDPFSKMYRELLERLALYAPGHLPIVITGSGTTGIEFLIDSSLRPASVWEPHNPFSSRIVDTLRAKDKLLTNAWIGEDVSDVWAVQYDPCICEAPNLPEIQFNAARRLFVDAVSSWPYYSAPVNASAFATVSSKQIAGAPVLSFVFCTREFILQSRSSQLLKAYARAYDFTYFTDGSITLKDKPQTPNTPAIPLMQHALKKLRKFNLSSFRQTIDDRRRALSVFPFIKGEGPVVTLDWDASCQLIDEEFYFKNEECKLFLWSGTDDDFKKLIHRLEGIKYEESSCSVIRRA